MDDCNDNALKRMLETTPKTRRPSETKDVEKKSDFTMVRVRLSLDERVRLNSITPRLSLYPNER